MTDPNAARAGLADFAQEMARNFESVAKVVEAPLTEADRDPLSVLPYLQVYISQMPLDEFETEDWATLHADVVSFLVKVMTVRYGATWQIRDAPDSPRGYRYVLRPPTPGGPATRWIRSRSWLRSSSAVRSTSPACWRAPNCRWARRGSTSSTRFRPVRRGSAPRPRRRARN